MNKFESLCSRVILRLAVIVPLVFFAGCVADDPINNGGELETPLGTVVVDEPGESAVLVEEKIVKEDGITGESADLQGSTQKPVPDDLPVLEFAENVGWSGENGAGMLSYAADGTDYEKICDEQVVLLKEAGWEADGGVAFVLNGSATATLNREGYILSVNCSLQNGTEDQVVVSLSKGPN